MFEETYKIMATIPMHSDVALDYVARERMMSLLSSGQLVNPTARTLEVIDIKDLTAATFNERLARNTEPCIVRGIPKAEGWVSDEAWSTADKFVERHGEVPIKIFEVWH